MKYTAAKIQSQSDIITNSSSEAFMVVTTELMNEYKEVAQNVLTAFGIEKPFDDVLLIVPEFKYDFTKQLIKHFILTGHLITKGYNESDIERYEKEGDYQVIEGYPVCQTEEEITEQIFIDAAVVYNMNTNAILYREGYPNIQSIYFKEKTPEYKQIADALTNLISVNGYEVFYC